MQVSRGVTPQVLFLQPQVILVKFELDYAQLQMSSRPTLQRRLWGLPFKSPLAPGPESAAVQSLRGSTAIQGPLVVL